MPLRPDIRFCTTADGAKIAVGIYGHGPPLVRAGTWLTHVEYDATSPLSAHWCDELAKRHRYIAYDSRGCGLSDRQVHELSLDVFVADLEAVVDGLGLERFPLFGLSMGAPARRGRAAQADAHDPARFVIALDVRGDHRPAVSDMVGVRAQVDAGEANGRVIGNVAPNFL